MKALVYHGPNVATRQLNAARFVTHHFTFDEFMTANEVFSNAAETGALEVVLGRAVWA